MAFTVLQALLSNPAAANAAAGTDQTCELGVVPTNFAEGGWLPVRTSLVSPALLTGATATQIVFTFQNRRAGSVIGTFASLTTATGVNLPAGTEVVATPGAVTSLLAGDVLEVVLTHAGAGTAYGAILAKVELE
jgi:hypothetical protein